MKLKNPIKLWKEPVTTFEEVEQRKKDLKPWIIISAILCLVTIGIFMLMYFGFLYYIVNKINKKFEALTCSNCSEMAIFKTKEEFEKYVTYSIIGGKANYHGINHPSANNGIISYVEAKASATATVVISLTCPHCGAVKKLEYIITPFICSSKEEKIFVRDLELVKIRLEQSVKEVVEIFNDPLRHHLVPYSIQSVNHPNYENRGKLQLPSSAYGYYNGVEIKYHRDVEELVEGFFVHNELNGKIVDHNKKNKKAIKNKSKQEVIKSESKQEEILNDNTKLNDQDLVNGINRKNSKKKKPLVLLIIAIIVVALIIGGVVLYFKLKHTHDYINEITYPTCEEIGFIEYRCACGDSYLSDIILEATGHTEVIDNAIDATCTSTGLTEGKHCSVCEKVLIAQEVIPMLAHTEVVDNAIDSTCTSTGLTEGKHCSVCEKVLIAQEVIPSLGHSVISYPAIAATCTENGCEAYEKCNRCDYTTYTEINALGHDIVENYVHGVCESDSIVYISCSACEYETSQIVSPILASIEKRNSIVIGMYIYSVSFTIDAIGGYGELLYKYEVLTSESNSTCILFEDYSTENSFGFQSSNPLNDRVLRITIKDQFENVTVYEILVDNAKVLVDGEILNSTGHRYEDNICTECGELYYSRGLNYVYLDDLDGYEISSIGSCKDEIIYIPDMYNDKPIVSIGKNAFKNSNIKGVYIPDSVLEIKEYAFYNSYKLREVFLSQDSQLKKIEQWAFSGCVMLSSFVLPANVEEMAQDSFFGCEKLLIVYNLSTLNVEKGTNREYFLGYYAKEVKNNLVPSENLKQEGDFIYYKTNSKTYLVSYVGDSNVIILPDTLNGSSYWIYQYAFSHLDINHLVISKGVIGFEGRIDDTFESSKENINSISVSLENTIYKAEMNCLIEKSTNKLIFACNNSIIPNYITAIGEGSFAECNGIKFIEIPSSVRVIENWAFYECRNLETIIINDGVEIIESFAFSLCTSLRSVSLPNTLITIKDNAFTNCYLLETIFIPKSVETIEGGAFKYFSALKNITVDEENSKYKSMDGALYSKDGKELILYPEGKNEKHIIIPEGVEIIGDYAFDDFDSLVSVTLPSTIKTIGYYAFSSCYNLEYVIITNNVSYIDHAAFGWCSKLTIYSYFPSQPENWDPDWNYSNRPVYWAGEWEYDTNGKPVPII